MGGDDAPTRRTSPTDSSPRRPGRRSGYSIESAYELNLHAGDCGDWSPVAVGTGLRVSQISVRDGWVNGKPEWKGKQTKGRRSAARAELVHADVPPADRSTAPAGKFALRAAELLAAGKTDDVIRLRTAADPEEWKKESAKGRQEMTERMKGRAPEPKAFSEAIRKGGVLNFIADGASLEAPWGAGGEVRAILALEKGKWFLSLPPMVLPGEPAPGAETRLRGEEILKHPIYELALRYADAIHSGPPDAFLKLASKSSQEAWKAEPASERTEITSYYKRNVPKRADLAAGIRSGGVLIIENDSVATLNVITVESSSKEPGVVQSTSTTVGIPFVLEDGQWKVKR